MAKYRVNADFREMRKNYKKKRYRSDEAFREREKKNCLKYYYGNRLAILMYHDLKHNYLEKEEM